MAQNHSSLTTGGRGGMVDATDLKSVDPKRSCGFKSLRPHPFQSFVISILVAPEGLLTVYCWYRFRLHERHDIEDMAVPCPRYHSGATENDMIQRFQIYCHQSLCFSLNFRANSFLVFLKPPLYLPSSPRTCYVGPSIGWTSRLVLEMGRRWEPIFYFHPDRPAWY